MRGFSIARGVTAATLAAGPLVALPAVISDALARAANAHGPVPLDGLIILPFSVVIGGLIALLPNLLGATLLAMLGSGNVAARLPVFWALVGAGAGALLGSALVTDTDHSSAAFLAVPGVFCALICRWGTRWHD